MSKVVKDIFSAEKSPCSNDYKIAISLEIAEYISKPIGGSWNTLFARLYGLPYHNFLRMVRDNFNGTLRGKTGKYIYFTFENKSNADDLVQELNNRWTKIYGRK